MLLKRIYHEGLAQASYLVASEGAGEAIVVDPSRDVEQYLVAAHEAGVRITAVTETHIHADFLSGARELARRAGARLMLSAEGGPDWRYAFAERDGATLLRNGDTIRIGPVRLDVLHTPGHTPEHITFVVTDEASSPHPVGALTGDFLFVGDVGRPDLLERAAGHAGTMEAGARQLHASIRKLDAMPAHLQIWPGHGAGSACGKALGALPQSTLGYERLANWALADQSEEDFVREVLAGQPDPPPYFARMKTLNREGPPMRPSTAASRSARDHIADAVSGGAFLLDVRRTDDAAALFVDGAVNIPLGKSFLTWAGWLAPYDRDIYLVAADEGQARRAVHELALIGIDRVAGFSDAAELVTTGARPDQVPQTTPAGVAEDVFAGRVTVLDVRHDHEWEQGHIPGAVHVPLGKLRERLAEVPRDRPVVTQCQGGTRSAIAASLLRAAGRRDVTNLRGGFGEWERGGHPISRDGHER